MPSNIRDMICDRGFWLTSFAVQRQAGGVHLVRGMYFFKRRPWRKRSLIFIDVV